MNPSMSPSPAKNIEVTSSFIQVGRPPGKSAASSQISVCWYAGEARAMWSAKKRKAKENYLSNLLTTLVQSLFWNSFRSSRTFWSGPARTSRFHNRTSIDGSVLYLEMAYSPIMALIARPAHRFLPPAVWISTIIDWRTATHGAVYRNGHLVSPVASLNSTYRA